MTLRVIVVFTGIILISSIIPLVSSQLSLNSPILSEQLPPRLYSNVDHEDVLTLRFGPRYEYWEDSDFEGIYYYNFNDYFRGTLTFNEDTTFIINDVDDRIYNPEVNSLLNVYLNPIQRNYNLTFQLRCDGDGDGIFEYIIDFEFEVMYGLYENQEPSSISGEPRHMTNGTIELEIMGLDDNSASISFNNWNFYLQLPFDLDTDHDGTGDFSDEDDDGDGYLDYNDVLPYNPNEWRDSDWDGIGDNADDDDNGNNIPDDLEIPLAMGIVLVPLVIIMAVMNKMKKKGKKEEEGDWGEEDIPILTTPHEGPKNW